MFVQLIMNAAGKQKPAVIDKVNMMNTYRSSTKVQLNVLRFAPRKTRKMVKMPMIATMPSDVTPTFVRTFAVLMLSIIF